jgi:lipopolysaccharide kinase (Kdo/WaaP) family protein
MVVSSNADPARFLSASDRVEQVIKSEPDTWVARFERDGQHLVHKRYLYPLRRALFTFGLASRARRELVALTGLAAAGLPCTPAVAGGEVRRCGLVRESWIDTQVVDGALTLQQWAAGTRNREETSGPEERLQLTAAAGELLRRTHEAGFQWLTAAMRNVLVRREPEGFQLFICDVPYCSRRRRSLVGTPRADLDLWEMVASSGSCHSFDREERLNILRAYWQGDERAAEQALGRLERFRHRWYRLRMEAVRFYSIHIDRGIQPEVAHLWNTEAQST